MALHTLLLGQNYTMAYAVIFLAILLGLLTMCLPRPRKKYQTDAEAKAGRMVKVQRKRPQLANSPAAAGGPPQGQAGRPQTAQPPAGQHRQPPR